MPNDTDGSVTEWRAERDSVVSLLAAIVDSSDDAIVSKTLDGIITSWNTAAERIFGYTSAEAIGKSIRMIIPSERQAEEDYVLEKVRRGERVEHFETVRQTKTGGRINISLTVSPIKNPEGLVVGASKIARDITANKRMADKLVAAHEQLTEALAGRDEFIAVATHELRNPLNVLSMLWQLPDSTSSFETRKVIEKSRTQLQRLLALMDRLMEVTRLQSGTFELNRKQFNLSTLVHEVAGRFLIEDPELTILVQSEPRIEGNWDPLRIDEVVTNLISNAIKYGQSKPIIVNASTSDGHAIVTVKDEGIGISPKDVDRIFEPFERAAMCSREQSLGIGLWITSRIVKAHRGTVLVSSQVGKGSTFIVRLPLNQM